MKYLRVKENHTATYSYTVEEKKLGREIQRVIDDRNLEKN